MAMCKRISSNVLNFLKNNTIAHMCCSSRTTASQLCYAPVILADFCVFCTGRARWLAIALVLWIMQTTKDINQWTSILSLDFQVTDLPVAHLRGHPFPIDATNNRWIVNLRQLSTNLGFFNHLQKLCTRLWLTSTIPIRYGNVRNTLLSPLTDWQRGAGPIFDRRFAKGERSLWCRGWAQRRWFWVGACCLRWCSRHWLGSYRNHSSIPLSSLSGTGKHHSLWTRGNWCLLRVSTNASGNVQCSLMIHVGHGTSMRHNEDNWYTMINDDWQLTKVGNAERKDMYGGRDVGCGKSCQSCWSWKS